MPELLVCTVGGAMAPVVKSILSGPRPEKVIFVCSEESRRTVTGPSTAPGDTILGKLMSEGLELTAAHYEIVTLSDPQDLTECVREMERRLTPCVAEWRSRGPDGFSVSVDITGGTKCMSVALGLIARRWDCTLRYVGGEARSKDGCGVVLDGSEKVLVSLNPMDALGWQVAEDAITLCGAHEYAAAEKLLADASRRASRAIARSLRTLSQLAGTFSAWDRFEHRKALAQFDSVERNQNDLGEFLAPASAEEVRRLLPRWRARLAMLAEAAGPTRELICDLLANAERRAHEARYEDAVARLYRAIEALAQWRLAECWNIPNTERVSFNSLPPELRERWIHRCRTEDMTVSLAPQDSYRLLRALGDPLAESFSELGLADLERSPLVSRNRSILAHGFQPASENACRSLWACALSLASSVGIGESDLPRFPRLRHKTA